ncbi:MAG: hypothetical protein LC731_02990, partial [Acidobacteria bacterium]|nr:hypothetical protein [Acidobacteriota bacterium]
MPTARSYLASPLQIPTSMRQKIIDNIPFIFRAAVMLLLLAVPAFSPPSAYGQAQGAPQTS